MSLRTLRDVSGRRPPRRNPLSFLRAVRTGLHYVFVFLPLWGYYSFRQLARWQQAMLMALALGVTVTGLVMLVRYREARRIEAEVRKTWEEFDTAAKTLNLGTMEAKLAKVAQLKPGDPLIARRRREIEAGAGAPDDAVMVDYWMRRYLTEQNIPAAAEEAKKRVANTPSHWWSCSILALDALRRGQGDEARAHLQQLPSPMASTEPVDLMMFRFTLNLYRATGLSDASFRKYRALRIVPRLFQYPDLARQPPSFLLDLLEIYVDAFEDLDDYDDLPRFWRESSKAAQAVADDGNLSAELTLRLARQQLAQFEVLQQLQASKVLAPDRARSLGEELLERAADALAQVLKADPTETEGYLGLAKVATYRRRSDELMQAIDRGIEKARDRGRLVQTQYQLLHRAAGPGQLFVIMDQLHKRHPDDPALLFWTVHAAADAGRLDRALEMSKAAQKAMPDEVWPRIMEARVYLDQELNLDKALAILEAHKQLAAANPFVAEQYVRALALNGKKDAIPPFVEQLVVDAPNPAVVIPALRTALREGLAVAAADAAVKLLDRFETGPVDQGLKDLLYFVGESELAAAEPTKPGQPWSVARARTGVQALERFQAESPNDLRAANVLALLHLKGYNSAEAAERAAIPLRAALASRGLTGSMYATLGFISLAQSRYDEARSLLTTAIEKNPTAEEYVQLAVALYHLSDLENARLALRRASSLPRSARVAGELSQALSLIDGK